MDVGGESTRPGAEPEAVEDELRARGAGGGAARAWTVSIDTARPSWPRLRFRQGAGS